MKEIMLRPHQVPPQGNWRLWAILGDRNTGKTFAGARYVNRVAFPSGKEPPVRIIMVGPTLAHVRDSMVLDGSGVVSIWPHEEGYRPRYRPSSSTVIWPGGGEAMMAGADEPDRLRGMRPDLIWCDSVDTWSPEGEAWNQVEWMMTAKKSCRCVITSCESQGHPFFEALYSAVRDPNRSDVVITRAADNPPPERWSLSWRERPPLL